MRFAMVGGSLSVVSIGAMSEPVSTISKESRAAIDTRFEKDSPRMWLRYSQGHREYEPMDIPIGRELYTAPFIWIPSDRCRLEQYKGNWTCRDRFAVTQMDVKDGRIRFVEIMNASTGQIVYQWKEQNIGA